MYFGIDVLIIVYMKILFNCSKIIPYCFLFTYFFYADFILLKNFKKREISDLYFKLKKNTFFIEFFITRVFNNALPLMEIHLNKI